MIFPVQTFLLRPHSTLFPILQTWRASCIVVPAGSVTGTTKFLFRPYSQPPLLPILFWNIWTIGSSPHPTNHHSLARFLHCCSRRKRDWQYTTALLLAPGLARFCAIVVLARSVTGHQEHQLAIFSHLGRLTAPPPARTAGGLRDVFWAMSPNGRVFMTLREPIGANPRHRARVCGRAQCGGAARPRAAEPEALVHPPTTDGPSAEAWTGRYMQFALPFP